MDEEEVGKILKQGISANLDERNHLEVSCEKTKYNAENSQEPDKSIDKIKRKIKELVRKSGKNKSGKTVHACGMCGNIYYNKGQLKQHLKSHEEKEKPEHKCHLCPKSYSSSWLLKRHIYAHNGGEMYEKKYTCDHCGKQFSSSSHLVVHIRFHTGEKPYACDKCEKAFVDDSTRRRHMKTVHSDHKEFVCEVCGKEFSQKGHLKGHVLIHSDYKPYECSMCPKKYSDPRMLRRHEAYHAKRKTKCKPKIHRNDFLGNRNGDSGNQLWESSGHHDNVGNKARFSPKNVENISNSNLMHTEDLQECGIADSTIQSTFHGLLSYYPKQSLPEAVICEKLPQLDSISTVQSINKSFSYPRNMISLPQATQDVNTGAYHDSYEAAFRMQRDISERKEQYPLIESIKPLSTQPFGDNTVKNVASETSNHALNSNNTQSSSHDSLSLEFNGRQKNIPNEGLIHGSSSWKQGITDDPQQIKNTPILHGKGFTDELLPDLQGSNDSYSALDDEYVQDNDYSENEVGESDEAVSGNNTTISVSGEIFQNEDGKDSLKMIINLNTASSKHIPNCMDSESMHNKDDQENTSGNHNDVVHAVKEECLSDNDFNCETDTIQEETTIIPNVYEDDKQLINFDEKQNLLNLSGDMDSDATIIDSDFERDEKYVSKSKSKGKKRTGKNSKQASALKTLEGKDKKYFCDECDKQFHTKQRLKVHMRTHSGLKPEPCTVCNKSFYDKSTLFRHKKIHAGVRSFVCSECGKCFVQSAHLRSHMNVHITERAYKCDECESRFKNKRNLTRHKMRVHTPNRPVVHCDKCGKTFADIGSLKHHSIEHDSDVAKMHCEICAKPFVYQHKLRDHLLSHSTERPFACTLCTKTYKHQRYLDEHIMASHTDHKPFVCELCGRKFTKKRLYQKHRLNHAYSGGADLTEELKKQLERKEKMVLKRRCVCNVCNAVVRDRQVLKIHMRKHTGERPFLCEVCNKTFTNSYRLKVHSWIHSGENPYKCQTCGKGFKQTTLLAAHMVKYKHETPFVCVNCNKKFTTARALEIHMLKQKCEDIQDRGVTDGDCFMCDLCFEEFKSKSDYDLHLAKCHKDI